MSLGYTTDAVDVSDPLDVIEQVIQSAGVHYERDDDDAIQCVMSTRWGEMGALFAYRSEPAAIHFSVTLDVKPQAARRSVISELIILMNERLWLGHFDYWVDEDVILFRQAIPMLDRDHPTEGEIRAVFAAATDAVERFVPAFNFAIWAGKTPREAIEATLFETLGEA